MGVKECHRRDCDNIMCDTYLPDFGYICYECQSEFEDVVTSICEPPIKESMIALKLKEFMNTSKSPFKDDEMTVTEFFDKHG